jgi:hemoglobin
VESMNERTVYEQLGGEETVSRLVEHFYARVVKDPELAPLFEDSNIDEVIRKQKLFLTQFLGGPPQYSAEFGHPMLRFRHLPFEITPSRADAWLRCMAAAMEEAGLEGNAREFVYQRLTQVAHHMVNKEV